MIILNNRMQALAALTTSGCYIYASPTAESRAKIRDFLVENLMDSELEFIKLSDVTEYHVTMMYSNRNPWENLQQAVAALPSFAPIQGTLTGALGFGEDNTVAVLDVESPGLADLHENLKKYLVWDSQYDWHPHCTIAKTKGDASLKRLFDRVVARLDRQLKVNPISVEFDFVAPDIIRG